MLSWNPVFSKVVEIKSSYENRFGPLSYEQADTVGNTYMSCLNRWAVELGDAEYLQLLTPLIITQYEKRILIRYGQFGTLNIGSASFWDLHDGFYRECRSLVLDLESEEIILSPFRKFMNLGETEENQLDRIREQIEKARSVEFSEKLDGSMQSARLYNGTIVLAGSQALDPSVSWRLQDGYRKLELAENYRKMISDHPNLTFIFENISLEDAHVVQYSPKDEGLYLVGIRDVTNGRQSSYNEILLIAREYDIWTTHVHETTFDDVIGSLDTFKATEKEGYVLNIDGHMVKIKTDDYVQIHKLLDDVSSVNVIIRNIAHGTYDDLISKVPNAHKARIQNIAQLIFDYAQRMDQEVLKFFSAAPREVRKTFFMWIESNVPRSHRSYVTNLYMGKENNYLAKSVGGQLKYTKFHEMGYGDDVRDVLYRVESEEAL